MMKEYKYLILLSIINISISLPICIEDQNHCEKCHKITNLCFKCDKDVFIPDNLGGCQKSKKCRPQNNHCLECNEYGDLCNKCEISYYPDNNGGCSLTKNCEVSYDGNCLECIEGYMLIGQEYYEGIKVCKSKNSPDFKYCNITDVTTGFCLECLEGYYLGLEDFICTQTKNCSRSKYGICTKCITGYYLDKKNNECVFQNKTLVNCKLTIDNKTCDICEDDFYLEEDGNCISINYCLKGGSKCTKCSNGYYPTENKDSCTLTENCSVGDKAVGVCTQCNIGYYLDYKDGKCKSNEEDNIFKYCKEADGDCYQCIYGYELGKDKGCSTSKNCDETENGTCLKCKDNYYLGLDNKCTNVEHCIYSKYYSCTECENGYYYNKNIEKCKIAEGDFLKCKIGFGEEYCLECKDDFYLNQTDNNCYDNNIKDRFFKCAFTDFDGEYCDYCIEGYYLGEKDKKCSKIEGCILSEDEENCLECGESYCLDVKEKKCVDNDIIEDIEKKFYYRCNKTNKEGTACEICADGNYTLNGNGICFDNVHCIEEDENGSCLKCKNDYNSTYCLNEYFGCEPMIFENCLECNDLLDLYKCTKCIEGYELNQHNICFETQKNK